MNEPPRSCELIVIRRYSPPCTTAWSLPTSGPLDTGVWDNLRERRSPLLGKGGDAAPSSKWSRSFGGAARSVSPVGRNIKNGVVRSTSDNRWLEPTTPSAPAKEASRHFLNGRSHPSLSKEGTSGFPSVVFNAPCPAKDVGHGKPNLGGEFFAKCCPFCRGRVPLNVASLSAHFDPFFVASSAAFFSSARAPARTPARP